MAHAKDISRESASPTFSDGIATSQILIDPLGLQTANDILKRTLSVATVKSTTSSAVDRMKAARDKPSHQHKLRDIGRGSCGSVFEIPGTPYAIKKGASTAAMWNDFTLGSRAYNSHLFSHGLFERTFGGRRVPRVPMPQSFNGPAADEFWTANIELFPDGDQTRAAAFSLDRILPVPQLTRRALVRQFFEDDERTQHDVLNNPDNKDCLVRVYLGKNRPNARPYDSTDTLRNFPLHLDEAKMLELDVDAFAEEIAMGLATLHWKAGIDAQDTEFVIGTSKTRIFAPEYPDSVPPPDSTGDDLTRREVQLWMLDFDKCSMFDLESKSLSSDMVEKYLVAVTGNDPYFPHPCLDVDLWQRFRETYLKASDVLIRHRRQKHQMGRLPRILIGKWEQWGKMDAEADDFDPFERSSDDDEVETDSEEDGSSENENDSSENEDDPDDNKDLAL
ncbi:hypothetical protein B0A52_04073 [Exophiala mesophila]|uniref:DUF3669 domain-containing protein n=1 Tax=Exophiala mesophila TaxID=212818 RepID=A0A438NAK1_EXOME|nr:hypothetical protein B0A52_04073 [Exophiala mesophila]